MDDPDRAQERPPAEAPEASALDDDDLDDVGELEEVDEHDVGAHDLAVATQPENASEEASLDELLARRAARRGANDADEDADIMSMRSSRATAPEPSPQRGARVRNREEFACSRCHLVKPKVQLVDRARGLCRDCA